MADIQNIDLQAIQKATPDNLKASGTAKLGTLIFAQGKVINQLLDPISNKLLSQVTTPDGTCVSQQTLDSVIAQRNSLVLQLNNIGKNIGPHEVFLLIWLPHHWRPALRQTHFSVVDFHISGAPGS